MSRSRNIAPPTSANVDITVAKNTSFSDAFQFDDPTLIPPPAWDFNGKTFRMDIKGYFEQAAPLLTFTSGASQIIVDDPVARIMHFNVPEGTLQAALVPGCYIYDLIMTDIAGVRTQLMHGDFKFAEGVTGG